MIRNFKVAKYSFFIFIIMIVLCLQSLKVSGSSSGVKLPECIEKTKEFYKSKLCLIPEDVEKTEGELKSIADILEQNKDLKTKDHLIYHFFDYAIVYADSEIKGVYREVSRDE